MESLENLGEKFRHPDFEAEIGEFERVSIKFGIPVSDLLRSAESAELNFIEDDVWESLENTDSTNIKPGDWAEVDTLAKQAERDWEEVKRKIEAGVEYAPIILKHNGEYHLVSGNTRLMVCKAMGIVPKVLVFEVGEG
jgi:hypothetical protein